MSKGKEFKAWNLPENSEGAEIAKKARDLIPLVYGLLKSRVEGHQIPSVIMMYKFNDNGAYEAALSALQQLGFEIKVDSANPDWISISDLPKPGFLAFIDEETKKAFKEEVRTALLNIVKDSISKPAAR